MVSDLWLKCELAAHWCFPRLKYIRSADTAVRQQNTDAVMTHIAVLLPPDYRGAYSSYVEEN